MSLSWDPGMHQLCQPGESFKTEYSSSSNLQLWACFSRCIAYRGRDIPFKFLTAAKESCGQLETISQHTSGLYQVHHASARLKVTSRCIPAYQVSVWRSGEILTAGQWSRILATHLALAWFFPSVEPLVGVGFCCYCLLFWVQLGVPETPSADKKVKL